MSKTFLFQAIQFNQTIQFSTIMLLILFNPKIGPHQVLPHRARVDLGAMAMRGHSVFLKAPAYWNLTIRLFSVIFQDIHCEGSYPSAELQSVYSTAPADWASTFCSDRNEIFNYIIKLCRKSLHNEKRKSTTEWGRSFTCNCAKELFLPTNLIVKILTGCRDPLLLIAPSSVIHLQMYFASWWPIVWWGLSL